MPKNHPPDLSANTSRPGREDRIEQNWQSAAESAIMGLAELLGELVAAEEENCEGER